MIGLIYLHCAKDAKEAKNAEVDLDIELIVILLLYSKLNNIDFIDFLKVDCEGGEYDIFIEDNASFLRERVNKIALEYHGPYHGIIKFLKENEFTVEHGDLNDTLGIIYAKNNSQKIK